MPMNAPLPPVSLGENSPHPVAVPLLARRGTRSHAAWDAELMAKRLDTRLESEGAEFLVLGNLLIAGIEATKAYRNLKGLTSTQLIRPLGTSVVFKSRVAGQRTMTAGSPSRTSARTSLYS
jgi:hypothetical protein